MPFEVSFNRLKRRCLQQRFDGTDMDSAIREASRFAAENSSDDDVLIPALVRDITTGAQTPVETTLCPPPVGQMDIHWAVRLTATTPEEAASAARLLQFDPRSMASVYRVCDYSGVCQVIDLQGAAARH